MPQLQNHIVRTVCFETLVPGEEDANVFAHNLRSIDCEELLGDIMRDYDQITETVKIDTLELDIGTFNPGDMDSLADAIRAKLRYVLTNRIMSVYRQENGTGANNQQDTPDPGESPESLINLLLHYLSTGSLLWNKRGRPRMEEILLELLSSHPLQLKHALLPMLANEIVINRIITNFSKNAIDTLTKALSSEDDNNVATTIKTVVKKQQYEASLTNIIGQMEAIHLRSIYESFARDERFHEIFITYMIALLKNASPEFVTRMTSEVAVLTAKTVGVESRFYSAFERELLAIFRQREEVKNKKNHTAIVKSDDATTAEATIKKESSIAKKDDIKPSEETGIDFIDNAGLVLLNAALLQRAFEQQGWVKDKKVSGSDSLSKMILWMDYLVWGNQEVHEYGLTLNKVLSGIAPPEVADIRLSLDSAEKEAADELLRTVIYHWSILKNTGIDSFRKSFLQRNGRLSCDDGGWQLHAESKGYDILIDSLPWSYSIIKFPWMDKPLFTQWQTKI